MRRFVSWGYVGRVRGDHWSIRSSKQSRHKNMKELRPGAGGAIRILFAFDPRRYAILLIGGDKAGRWNDWYEEFIPKADDLYDEHLETLRKEGLL